MIEKFHLMTLNEDSSRNKKGNGRIFLVLDHLCPVILNASTFLVSDVICHGRSNISTMQPKLNDL